MQLRDKVGYIWDYYKLWLIGAVVAVGLLVYFLSLYRNGSDDVVFKAAFVNFYDDVSDSSDFALGFKEYLEGHDSGSGIEGVIEFDNNMFFNLNKNSDYYSSYYQKLIAYLESGTLDCVICGYDNLMGIGQGGRFIDLSDERIKSVYDMYSDRIVYISTEEGDIPIGIDISDSPVLSGMNGYGESCYLAFSANSAHFDKGKLFLEYLLEEE
jgi:hypothetical protein